MKEKKRGKEALKSRMNPMEERGQCNRLFVEGVPVWYNRNGQVNPGWLSACEEERNPGGNLMEQIADPLNLSKAYQQVKGNGGSAGVDGMKVEALQEW